MQPYLMHAQDLRVELGHTLIVRDVTLGIRDREILTIIGQIEGHQVLPETVKTTKYEHVMPLLAAATPRAVWLEADTAALAEAGILRGGDVMKHLEGCPQALLLAVTLGPGVDAQIRRAGVGDIAAGVASDALGSALAEQLSREGHEITIVDRSGTPLQRTVEDLDILSVEGNGATYATQIEAGVDEADLVIAVTAQDELNLLCCLVAKKIGARHTIARVRNPEYAGELSLISDDLGLSLSVNPELICATEMARTLRTPSAIKTDTFFGGKVELLKFQLPADSPLSGKTLMELPSVTKAKVLVCAVERGEQEIHIPSGGFRLQSGDRISFVASYGGAQQFFRQMKLAAGRVRSVMLIGGGRIAYYLARQLIEAGLDVKILESDQARCEELSVALPKAEILCGDGTNEAFLRKCGIETTDAVAALTGIDEENVLIGMYIRKTWPKIKVITKVNRTSFQSIIDSMDLGSVFNPRNSASNLICRYVRAMQNSESSSQIETLYKLVGGKAEALEFRVSEGSKLCGVPLQELRLRENLLIGCIGRGGKILIPSGQDTIEPGDSVIVVTCSAGLGKLEDILARGPGHE